MRQRIDAARTFLLQAQQPDGGWPYRMNGQPSPEPTCYSLLALMATNHERMHKPTLLQQRLGRGMGWLLARRNADGALTLLGDNEPHWSTALFVVTALRLQSAPRTLFEGNLKPSSREIRNPKSEIQNVSDLGFRASDFPAGAQGLLHQQSVQWLLSWYGNTSPPREVVTLNGQLRGWPWISDTFSWVEPTSYAVLALKLAGYRTHWRVREAEELLLDRACEAGGWNYGNRIVLGRGLMPFPVPTAMAVLALQDAPSARQRVEQALAFLQREVSQHPSTLSLALSIHCFHIFNWPMQEFVNRLAQRQSADGSWRQSVHLTALATLALQCATGGFNAFKL
ncbi:MAG: terpene cyclase/mutase family protein [Acidobacteriota bacterium]|nr:terpene cyclase/mutase family protein [Blastocatellia bacterium]MDW8240866.1 terpene cyclase/mutase family protein [Acidobacteriota bacterium]